MNKIYTVILSFCIVTTFSSNTIGAENEQKAPFNLGQAIDALVSSKRGPIQDQGKKIEILKDLQQFKLEEDEVKSIAYDQVVPVRTPVFISTDPSSELAEILVTRTRPTTIAFLDQSGNPYEIEEIIQATSSEIDSSNRFSASLLGQSNYVVKFGTTVMDGWTTVDFKFKEIPYTIPVKIVPSKYYHSGAQAIIIDDVIERMIDSSSGKQGSSTSGISDSNLTQILSTLANYGPRKSSSALDTLTQVNGRQAEYRRTIVSEYQVEEKSADDIKLEYMSIDRFDRPRVELYKKVVSDTSFYLIRTNGVLVKPNYVESVPNSSIGSRIWAYAIPSNSLGNIISINYGGGNHIYAVTPSNQFEK